MLRLGRNVREGRTFVEEQGGRIDDIFVCGQESKSTTLRRSVQSLPEQTAVAEVLSDMDAELAALEQKRDKSRLLKQGMMQELLTGKTRLI